MHADPLPLAGLPRTAAAAVYDGLLVLAVLMLVTYLMLVLSGSGAPIAPGNTILQAILLATAAGFFVGFWTHGGQTLGMNAWRLRVEMQNGEPVRLATALLRFLSALLSLACFGLGFLWQLVDSQSLTWHDRLAGTRVVVLPKRQRASRERTRARATNVARINASVGTQAKITPLKS